MERDELYQELKECAFEALKLHPGVDYREWKTILTEQYAAEVEDAFGCLQNDVDEGLAGLWADEYEDPFTERTQTMCEWAQQLKDEEALDDYYKEVIPM